MTVFIVREAIPNVVRKINNVIMIDKLENGHLIIVHRLVEDITSESFFHDVISCEVN